MNHGDDFEHHSNRTTSDTAFLIAALILVLVIAAGNVGFRLNFKLESQPTDVGSVTSQGQR